MMSKVARKAKGTARKKKMTFRLLGKSLKPPNYCMRISLNHGKVRGWKAKGATRIPLLNAR